MTTFQIELTEDEVRKLEHRARESGLTPEELLRKSVTAWLDCPKGDFAEAASYVLCGLGTSTGICLLAL